jgi:DNA-binding NtrC family response regulator
MLLQGTKEMGFLPTGAASAEQALRVLEQQSFPVIILDLNLPGIGGMDLLQAVRQRWPAMQAIVLTGFGDLESARQAIHLDVVDFLTKPCALGDLEIALSRAFRRLEQIHPTALDATVEMPEEVEDEEEEEEAPSVPPARKGKDGLAFAPRDGSEALSMEDVERRTILAALEKHGGNRAAAAEELGISLRKLYYRLGEYQKKGLIT